MDEISLVWDKIYGCNQRDFIWGIQKSWVFVKRDFILWKKRYVERTRFHWFEKKDGCIQRDFIWGIKKSWVFEGWDFILRRDFIWLKKSPRRKKNKQQSWYPRPKLYLNSTKKLIEESYLRKLILNLWDLKKNEISFSAKRIYDTKKTDSRKPFTQNLI